MNSFVYNLIFTDTFYYLVDLSDLQLNRTIPPKISTLSHLEFLDVSNNTLSGSIASEFSNLRNLGR